MNKIDISEAFGAGFRLIRRKPLAPLVWGLVYLVLFSAPIVLAMRFVGPHLAVTGAAPLAALGPIFTLLLVELVFGVLSFSILNAAIYRSVLEPEDDGAFYLRFGGQEFTQGLVLLALGGTFIAVLLAVGIVFGILAAVVGGALHVGANGSGASGALGLVLLIIPLYIAIFGAMIWLWVRLSLGGPMSFARRSFRLFDSWKLTKGNGWRLFGIVMLIIVVTLVFDLLFWGVLFAIGGAGALGAIFTPGAPASTAVAGLGPAGIIFGCLSSLVAGYVFPIVGAPWADAYRQLSGDRIGEVFSDAPSPAPL